MRANFAERLLQHYVDNSRDLPWRSPPGQPPQDPYRVWLSEIMLQQTTVAAVAPRFERFVSRWPTIDALAAAPDEAILSEWAGLGYYARARNLIACAREVAALGGFPSSESDLRKLPGIGEYTAAAIAAIAFGHRSTVIDSNVERVVSRLCGLRNPTRAELREAVRAIAPPERVGDFAQAMMDLGAINCRPRKPLCECCPLSGDCLAFASGDPERYPERRKVSAKPHRFGTANWTERNGRVWLVRRPPRGLLGGMAALPGGDWTERPAADDPNVIARVKHVFTHFSLDLAVVRSGDTHGDGWWQAIDCLGDAGLPTLYRKAAEAVLSA